MSGTAGYGFSSTLSIAARATFVVALFTVSVTAVSATSLEHPKLSASGTRSLESTSGGDDHFLDVGPVLGEPERRLRKIQHSRGDLQAATTSASTDATNSPQSPALRRYLSRRTLNDASRPGDRAPPDEGGGRPGTNG